MNHDKGRTLATILRVLREDLGYTVPVPRVINARHHGVPQNRERILIAGFREATDAANFSTRELAQTPQARRHPRGETRLVRLLPFQRYLASLRAHKDRHADKGNGFGFEIIPHDGTANAIVSSAAWAASVTLSRIHASPTSHQPRPSAPREP